MHQIECRAVRRLRCDALQILTANCAGVAASWSDGSADVQERRGGDPSRQHAREERLVEPSYDAPAGQSGLPRPDETSILLLWRAAWKKVSLRMCIVTYSYSLTQYCN